MLLGDSAHGEPSTLYTLDNRRNVDSIWMDLSSAKSREYDTTSINPFSPLVASDVDLDGYQEIFFATDDSTLVEYSTKDNEYRFLLTSIENGRFIHAPQLVDIDFDGHPELIVYDVGNDCMRCLNLTSDEERWTITGLGGMTPQPKIIIDEVSMGCLVLVGIGAGHVGLFDVDGKEIWTRSFPGTEEPHRLAVADVDYDDSLEFVVTWFQSYIRQPPQVGIEICDLATSRSEVNWTGYIEDPISIPPLCFDLVVDEPGMEIAFCSNSAGVLVLSSASGNLLWQHDVDYLGFVALEIIESRSSTILVATAATLVLSLDGNDGSVISSHNTRYFATKHDLPFTGFFDLDGTNKALLVSFSGFIRVLDPVTNTSIWSYAFPDGIRRCRSMCLKGDGNEAFSLHIFIWHMDLKTTQHIKLWVYAEDSISISADPSSFVAYPSVRTQISGIDIEGVGEGPEGVMLRLFDSRDRALINYHQGVFTASVFTKGMTVEGMSSALSDGKLSISFDLTAPWLGGLRSRFSMEVMVRTTDNTLVFHTFDDYIQVEGEVVLSGYLHTEDPGGERYVDGDWVPDGVDLTLRGAFLYFKGTSTPPLPVDVNVTLAIGGAAAVPLTLETTGEVMANVTIARGSDGRVDLEILLDMRWTFQDFVLTFHLNVDSTPPLILGVFPESGLWFGEDEVMVGCQATDGNGSGISRFELQYGPKGGQIGEWQRVEDVTIDGTVAEGSALLTLNDGSWDIVWRVLDRVGHGPITSEIITINIDTTDIEYGSFTPVGWSNQTPVEVSVTIQDTNGSGIDQATISYSVSTNGLFDFSDWVSLNLGGERDELVVTFEVELEEGVDNYIRFKAADVAGNERTSNAYRVRVDLSPPYFLDPLPDDEMVLFNHTLLECSVTIKDDLSGVDRKSVQYQYSTGPTGWSDWSDAPTLEGGEGFVGEVRRNEDGPTLVRWRARDLAQGEYAVSDIYVVNLNRPPEVIELLPGTSHRMTGGGRVSFAVNVSDPEGDPVAIGWYIDDRLISENASFDLTFEAGVHRLKLSLDDHNGNRLEVLITVVAGDDPDYTSGFDYLLGLILVAAIFAIAVVILYLRHRAKD